MKLTIEEFKEAYPEMYQSVFQEGFDKGSTDAYALGRTDGIAEGSDKERSRIKSIEDLAIAGHDALIDGLKFDGVTTGPEAAVKILAAEKELQRTKLAEFKEDNVTLVASPATTVEPETKEEVKKPAAEQIEDLVTKKMADSPSLTYAAALNQVALENKDLASELLESSRPRQQ